MYRGSREAAREQVLAKKLRLGCGQAFIKATYMAVEQ